MPRRLRPSLAHVRSSGVRAREEKREKEKVGDGIKPRVLCALMGDKWCDDRP